MSDFMCDANDWTNKNTVISSVGIHSGFHFTRGDTTHARTETVRFGVGRKLGLLPSSSSALVSSLPPLPQCVWEKPIGRSAHYVDSTLLCLGMPTLLIAATIYGPSVCEQGNTHKRAHSLTVNTATCSTARLTLVVCGRAIKIITQK